MTLKKSAIAFLFSAFLLAPDVDAGARRGKPGWGRETRRYSVVRTTETADERRTAQPALRRVVRGKPGWGRGVRRPIVRSPR